MEIPCLILSVFALLLTKVTGAPHRLIVGTFWTNNLYLLDFDDESLALTLEKNISVPVASSWISLSVRSLINVNLAVLLITSIYVQVDKRSLYGNAFNKDDAVWVSYSVDGNATDLVFRNRIPFVGNCTGRSIFNIASPAPPYALYGSLYYNTSDCR